MEAFLFKGDREVFSQQDQLTETFLQGIITPYVHEKGKISLIRNAAALNTNHTTALTPKLSSISHPVLRLWGAKDPWQHVEIGEMLNQDLPESKLVQFDHATHWVSQEAPQAFAAAIKQFI